ncbi:GMC family oxidoreductase [Trinickia caryophylli]|uniref:Choline dehydrogenase n=1 Tax=Trinickia caryophylli TaxID=28094 RepID=A0A1X7CG10_TRICW|nr:GMC family oxidoreductase [Trinickia caryophylli]PMS11593.1 GMC family oxidoreductase [Trinickia caryophylli]TRX19849.1 GMC family oxidoreductase [Trinickia caryophylli]WQE13615.1 GMC family oxidoreductase [Trinickia caryophylli]SME95930.1 Choline dehydrogenase [Trinickia caryophylli]GLU30538.1 GMC oxidoreductase [Trinickia caryophylli]
MFIDTRTVEEGHTVDTTVCIVGAGVAGITLALEMSRMGIDTCLLESGGYKADDETRDLYRGENVGLPYTFADGSRSRYLGGSSNCWGGWCRPLDPWDFDKRDWVAHSGWPFGLDELAPYYARTHAWLKLGPNNFDPAFWEQAIGRADVRRVPLVTGLVRDTIAQFSPPARFGKLYRKDLARSTNVRVFLHANVVDIASDPDAARVSHVDVATLSGRRIRMRARHYVLAAGGIENARLLLASNRTQPAGLGNGHDVVGRFFMDHPRIMSASVRFSDAWARNKLHDIKFHYQNAAVSAHGTMISSQFALTPEVLARERLLNARVWFFSMFYGEGSAAAEALIRCKQALLKKDQPGWRLGDDLATMAAHPVDTIGFGLTRLLQPRALITDVKLQAIVEAVPNRDSRVTLCTQRDALGMPRVSVAWRLDELVKRTFDRTFSLVAQELAASGVARVTLDAPLEGRAWPSTLEGTWHHMGTTRMHDSPKEGVVDRHCKVHGIENLHIAGSSVFPSVGANFPTITITALALRLAERLARVLGKTVPAGAANDARAGAAVDTLPFAAATLSRAAKE